MLNSKYTDMSNSDVNITELEQALGNPLKEGHLFSVENFLSLDEASEFPTAQADRLNQLGVQNYFIPSQQGGKLDRFTDMVAMLRCVYRRDATLGLGFGITSFIAAINVWMYGNDLQKQRLADILSHGGTVSVAYHEHGHGNDVLGNEVFASELDTGYELNGEKWVINNVAVCDALIVFARTNKSGGGRGFSLFFVDKQEIDSQSYQYLEKVKTFGVKGCRLSGIRFHQCHLPATSLVGVQGRAFEYTLSAFQITRTVLPGMAFGLAETAFMMALKKALESASWEELKAQPLHGKLLADSFLDLQIADGLSIAMARALHEMPEQMSIYANIVKYFVPSSLLISIKSLSPIFGRNIHLRKSDAAGFQKIVRDFPVVSLGHANTVVCLFAVATQLPQVLRKRRKLQSNLHEIPTSIKRTFTLALSSTEFDSNRLKMTSSGKDDLFNSFEPAVTLLKTPLYEGKLTLEHRSQLDAQLNTLRQWILDFESQAELTAFSANEILPEEFKLAETYVHIQVAICSIHLWLHSQDKRNTYVQSGALLIHSLDRILYKNSNGNAGRSLRYVEEVLNEIEQHHQYACSLGLYTHQTTIQGSDNVKQ